MFKDTHQSASELSQQYILDEEINEREEENPSFRSDFWQVTDTTTLDNQQSSNTTSDGHSWLKELKQELEKGMEKFSFAVPELPEEIERTKQQIEKLKCQLSKERALEKQEKLLKKLEHLQSLAYQIQELEKPMPIESTQLSILKRELEEGMEKFSFAVSELPEEIERTKQQIEKLKCQPGKEKALKKQEKLLKKLEHLQSLAYQIQELRKTIPVESSQLSALKRELQKGIEKVSSHDQKLDRAKPTLAVSDLPARIEKQKHYIQWRRREGDEEEILESHKKILEELEYLQTLSNQIRELEKHISVESDQLLAPKVQLEEDRKTPSATLDQQEESGEVEKVDQPIEKYKEKAIDKSFQPEEIRSVPVVSSDTLPLAIRGADLAKMPAYSERTIMGLRLVIQQMLKHEVDPLSRESAIEGLQVLYQQLETEDWLTMKNLVVLHEQAVRSVSISDWESFNMILGQMLLCIRPLDIQELLRLIEATEQAVLQVHDRDIILLLGKTGAGKSTTTHFLAGSKLALTRIEGMTCIAPVEIKNPQLQAVTVSPHMRSETRYVTAVHVSKQDVKARSSHMKNGIVICDSAGFGDTSGAEVNIANGIGLAKAVKGCRSVKLLVLIGKTGTGARYEIVREFIRSLVRFIPDIEEYLDAITYVFTGFSKDEAGDIHHKLKSLRKNLNDEEKADNNFVCLVEDLYHKTKVWKEMYAMNGDVMILDSLEDKPGEILDKLMRTDKITNPEKAFHAFVGPESEAKLEAQIRLHERSIENGIKRFDYALIVYKLDELRRLSDLLSNDARLREAYQRCESLVSTYLNELIEQSCHQLERGLADDNTLSEEEVKQYKLACSKLENADLERLIERHLGTEVNQQALITYLDKRVGEMGDIGSNASSDSEFLKNPLLGLRLKKLSSLISSFPEYTTGYENLCLAVMEQCRQVIQTAENAINSDDVELFAKQIALLANVIQNLAAHINEATVRKGYDSLKGKFISRMQCHIEGCDYLLKKGDIGEDELVTLRHCAQLLHDTRQNYNIQNQLDSKHLDEISQTFLAMIDKTFDQFIQTVKQAVVIPDQYAGAERLIGKLPAADPKSKHDDSEILSRVAQAFKNMDALRTIPGVATRTSEVYFETIHLVFAFIERLKNLTEVNLEAVALDTIFKPERYERLLKVFATLQDGVWVRDLQPETYDALINAITEDLIVHADQLYKQIAALKLSVKWCTEREIERLLVILAKADALGNFVERLPTLVEPRARIYEVYTREVTAALDSCQALTIEPEKSLKIAEFEQAFVYLENFEYLVHRQLLPIQLIPRSNKGDDVEKIQTQLRDTVSKYAEMLNEKITTAFEAVNQYPDLDTRGDQDGLNILIASVSQINNGLAELIYIRDHYERLFAMFPAGLIESFIGDADGIVSGKLYSHLSDLSDRMKRAAAVDNRMDLYYRLQVATSMRCLDKYIPDSAFDNYSQLNRRCQEEYYKLSAASIRVIQETIDANDYEKCKGLLVALDSGGMGISEDTKNMLKQLITFSVNRFLRDTRYKIIGLPAAITLSSSEIQKQLVMEIITIIEQLDQLRTVNELHFLNDYLDEKTKRDLARFISEDIEEGCEAKQLLTHYIKSLTKIFEANIRANRYIKATETMGLLSTMLGYLGRYCDKAVQEKITEESERLEKTIEETVKEYKDMEIKNYHLNPPKIIIERLNDAVTQEPKYSEVIRELTNNILTKMRSKLDLARHATDEFERKQIIREFSSALHNLPQDMKTMLEEELVNCKDDIKQSEKEYKERIHGVVESGYLNSIKKELEACQAEHRHSMWSKLKNEVLGKIIELERQIAQSVEADRGLSSVTLGKIEKLCEYQLVLSNAIPQIGDRFREVKSVLRENFDTSYTTVKSLADLDQEEEIHRKSHKAINLHMKQLQALVEFTNRMKERYDSCQLLSDDYIEKMNEVNKILYEFFRKIKHNFEHYLQSSQIPKLASHLSIIKMYGDLFRLVKELVKENKYPELFYQKLDELMADYPSFDDFKQIINSEINKWKAILSEKLINDETRYTESMRQSYYEQYNQAYLKLKSAATSLLTIHFSMLKIEFNTCQEDCVNNISGLIKDAFEAFKLGNYDNLNIIYNNLIIIRTTCDTELKQASNLDEKIEELKEKFFERVREIQRELLDKKLSANGIARRLISIKEMACSLEHYKESFDKIIDSILFSVMDVGDKEKRGVMLAEIALQLEEETIGQVLLAEHKAFKGQAVMNFNDKASRQGIGYVLEHMEDEYIERPLFSSNSSSLVTVASTLVSVASTVGSSTASAVSRLFGQSKPMEIDAKDSLALAYMKFRSIYETLLKEYISKGKALDPQLVNALVVATQRKAASISKKPGKNLAAMRWNEILKEKIIELMAHIFALWTQHNSEYFYEAFGLPPTEREKFLLQPHAAQVVSIFRMFAIGEKLSLDNHLIQIGTGEGKSVTLAVTAMVLVMLGFDVSCACYSDYLSQRDYEDFFPIFKLLDLQEYIHYGTFNKICENIINERGNVRDVVSGLITESGVGSSASLSGIRPKILLVDEVDVFFSKDFYGNMYTPQAALKDPTIAALLDFVWASREIPPHKLLRMVQGSAEYKACCEQFSEWEFIIQEAVCDMVKDVADFGNPAYVIHDGKVGYKDQDAISTKKFYGYKTVFAYYQEYEHKNVSQEVLNENKAIGINCGAFSYAEMPKRFAFILGVTGTLKTLNESEREIVVNTYGIYRNTYAPSVFGEKQLTFAQEADVRIYKQEDYYREIKAVIDAKLAGTSSDDSKRAVLVFFEDKAKLMAFFQSRELASIKDSIKIMTEEVNPREKERLIRTATSSGSITLLTRSFGRGTDFICRDKKVLANGGVHVVQTFLSAELSEETQIKGRTARQGQKGSYSMVLLDRDLETFLIDENIIKEMEDLNKRYETLNEKRNTFFKTQYATNMSHVAAIKAEHNKTVDFLDAIFAGNSADVKAFLMARNHGALISNSRTICLMDATGSMSHLIHKTKNTVREMFSRAHKILHDNDVTSGFEMQFAVYRNYNCREDVILQASGWESKPENLYQFMETIQARGGWGNEAIEIGLWHVNQEADKNGVSQVILIGDAPANTTSEVQKKRKDEHSGFGERYWSSTRFASATDYRTELKYLKDKEIKVHGFFVHPSAQRNFEEISTATGGRCEALDVNSPDGAERLTTLVTEEVLRNVGGDEHGDNLVDAYRAAYRS